MDEHTICLQVSYREAGNRYLAFSAYPTEAEEAQRAVPVRELGTTTFKHVKAAQLFPPTCVGVFVELGPCTKETFTEYSALDALVIALRVPANVR